MLILAVDTSGKDGSLALVRFEGGEQHTLEIVPIEGGTFSAQLVPQIAGLLRKHHLSKNEIEAFAVASGPGSFTGLRVGLAATKALAETLHKTIAAVSLLEALAYNAGRDGRIISSLDAGRGEVYAGTYEIKNGDIASRINETLEPVVKFASMTAGQLAVTPDARLAEIFRQANVNVSLVPRPRADTIARLGFEKIQRGETVSPETLDATYIRRSDAEIKFAK